MNLILIRHGETEWNRTGRCQGIADIDLNHNGKRQVQELADSLKEEKINAIYSSDLKRALETARAIAAHHKLKVNIEEDLREMNQGELEGLKFSEIREKIRPCVKGMARQPRDLETPTG